MLHFIGEGSGDLGAADLAHRYLWGNAVDQILADEQVHYDGVAEDYVTDRLLWPLVDQVGSVRDLAEYDDLADTTAITNHRVYDSFGNLQSETNAAVDCLFGFTARPFDEATGLQNNLNRWYDPAVGRWVSEDPIDLRGGRMRTSAGIAGMGRPSMLTQRGLWKPQGHRDATVYAMEKYGFDEEDIKTASDANAAVDALTNQLNDAEHYMPGSESEAERSIQDKIKEAAQDEAEGRHCRAMQRLGEAMHTAQDKSAHSEQNAGWSAHVPFFGSAPDDVASKPASFYRAKVNSESVLKRYFDTLDQLQQQHDL